MAAISVSLIRHVNERQLPIIYVVCDNWPVYAEDVDAWTSMFNGSVLRAVVGRGVEAALDLPSSLGDIGDSGPFCFVSQSTRRAVVSQKPWSYSMSTVVYSGIEREHFHEGTARPDRRWEWRLLYVGRLHAWKGVDTLLRALPSLPPQATLALYGRGGRAEGERLMALADSLGVSDRVTFGSLDRDELVAKYLGADVVVFPSEWPEPFGLVPLEAMACGTPVVATAVGGSGEYLRDGYNAVLYPAGDPAALAAAVRRLHVDPDLRSRVVRGGHTTAGELDVERLADVLEQWHVGAAQGFANGVPADRSLDLPDAIAGLPSIPAHESTAPARRLITGIIRNIDGLVLSVGCSGDAMFASAMAQANARTVVAVDADEQALRDGRSEGSRVMTVAADADRLPFRVGAFDAVVAYGTLERLADDVEGARELARVVRSGGVGVLATPNRSDALVARAKVSDRLRGLERPPRAYFHVDTQLREYSWQEFERLVEPVFRVRARYAVGWSRGWKSTAASVLLRVPPLRRLGQVMVLEVEPR
jgi:SAM-dependent methyltransferase